jgi:hypothetical protein
VAEHFLHHGQGNALDQGDGGGRVPHRVSAGVRVAGECLAALRTDAGSELARAVTSASPQWWAAFNASYSEFRASTRAHKQLRKPVE